jgi:hypothetical protein
VVGYPDRLVRSIGHPCHWIGRLIGRWSGISTATPRNLSTRAHSELIAVLSARQHCRRGAFVIERGF